jgi:hypothetical protein
MVEIISPPSKRPVLEHLKRKNLKRNSVRKSIAKIHNFLKKLTYLETLCEIIKTFLAFS